MNILIISLDKWGYNNFIAKALEDKGHTVTHFDMYKHVYKYPTIFHKLFNFISKSLFNYNLKREHLNSIIVKETLTQVKQDVTLVMNGDNLSIKTIKELKANTNHFVTFFNDSISRYPRLNRIFQYFDTAFSFDPDDVAMHNFSLATNYIYFDYENIEPSTIEHNIFNISSLDKRGEVLPLFANYFKSKNIKAKLIAFSGKKIDNLDGLDIEQTSKIYSLDDVLEIVKKSKILLDLQRPKQKGLSFRVFEALALEKKLITTNRDIVNYDFYNPNNIFLVEDTLSIVIPDDFFTTAYKKVDKAIVNKYHISSWVDNVFNL